MILSTLANWSPLEEKYARYSGRPAIHPEVMVRALLISSLYNITSYRRVVHAISENIAFRWFCFLSPIHRTGGILPPYRLCPGFPAQWPASCGRTGSRLRRHCGVADRFRAPEPSPARIAPTPAPTPHAHAFRPGSHTGGGQAGMGSVRSLARALRNRSR